MDLVEECTKREIEKAEALIRLEQTIKDIIYSTTAELLGDNEDPEDVLERFIQEHGLDRKEGKEKR